MRQELQHVQEQQQEKQHVDASMRDELNGKLREQIEFLKGRNGELSAQLKARAQAQTQSNSGENLRENEELNLLREQVHKLAEETSNFHDKLGAAERELIGERHKTRVAAYDEELRAVKNHNIMYRPSSLSTMDEHQRDSAVATGYGSTITFCRSR